MLSVIKINVVMLSVVVPFSIAKIWVEFLISSLWCSVLLVFDVVAGVWCYWCLYGFCLVLFVVVVNVSLGIGVTYIV
jgi:hypothetical protein